MKRLALHVHGDETAREKRDEIVAALSDLDDAGNPRTLADLNEAVRAVGNSLGFTAYAAEAKCVSDPLKTAIDTSFYRAA